ncbi:MAG: hypothetical protein HY835_08270, partial [Anaerolineae bacterium]|nr:hypothetical protein [Anaerolineae bacterium]
MSEESFVQNPEFPQPENQQTAEDQAGDAPTEFTRTAQVQINAEMDAVVNDSAVIVMAVGRDAQIHDSLLSGPTAIGGNATLTD